MVRSTAQTCVIILFCLHPVMNAQHQSTDITVFAASSLTGIFQAVAKNFEAAHPQMKIHYNFGGSQQLVQQIAQGASVDVVATANMKQIQSLITSGRIDSASVHIFAGNRLIIILPKDNPAKIVSIHDLSVPNRKIVLADASVPAGQYALEFLDKCSKDAEFQQPFKEQVLRNVVSYEENVKVVLSKVMLGECDAGIVYSSDISRDSSNRVRRIDIPERLNIRAEYPIAVARDTRSSRTADEFVDYLRSEAGQRLLIQFGFIPVKNPSSNE